MNNIPETTVITIGVSQDEKVVALYNEGVKLLEYAKARVVKSDADCKLATDDLVVITNLKKAIEDKRKEYVGPINAHLDAVNVAFKEFKEPIVKAEVINRDDIASYRKEVAIKALEAEEINLQAIELARRQAAASGGEFTINTAPIDVPHTPALTRSSLGTTGMAANWKYEITDLGLLPKEYMIPDDAMLKSIAKQHHDKKQVAGVRFFNDPGVKVYKTKR